jgi:lincosamide nucleotidyltransferase
MYGSFAKGEGDAYSDIEFVIYLDEAGHSEFRDSPGAAQAWVAQIAPVSLYLTNEFGTGVAIFENLVRGEFHFERAEDMAQVRAWKQETGFPPVESMLLVDRTGELTEHLEYIVGPGPERGTPAQVCELWHRYLNWMLFGVNVLARGERARALELLWWAQRYLLWFARLREGSTSHWQSPSKNVEQELSAEAYQRYVACTAGMRKGEMERAYRATWRWGKELVGALAAGSGVDVENTLVERLDARFAEYLGKGGQDAHL